MDNTNLSDNTKNTIKNIPNQHNAQSTYKCSFRQICFSACAAMLIVAIGITATMTFMHNLFYTNNLTISVSASTTTETVLTDEKLLLNPQGVMSWKPALFYTSEYDNHGTQSIYEILLDFSINCSGKNISKVTYYANGFCFRFENPNQISIEEKLKSFNGLNFSDFSDTYGIFCDKFTIDKPTSRVPLNLYYIPDTSNSKTLETVKKYDELYTAYMNRKIDRMEQDKLNGNTHGSFTGVEDIELEKQMDIAWNEVLKNVINGTYVNLEIEFENGEKLTKQINLSYEQISTDTNNSILENYAISTQMAN